MIIVIVDIVDFNIVNDNKGRALDIKWCLSQSQVQKKSKKVSICHLQSQHLKGCESKKKGPPESLMISMEGFNGEFG